MSKKQELLYTLLFITYFIAQGMENPAYLAHPEEYKEFQLKRLYGKCHFNNLPTELSNEYLRQPLAHKILFKFKHAILGHNYQEKKIPRVIKNY